MGEVVYGAYSKPLKMTKIQFSLPEYQVISQIGVIRHTNALRLGRIDRNNADKLDGVTLHIHGALGEAAVAKHLNLYWMGGSFRSVDVGDRYEVRTTTRKDGCLILRDTDNSDSIFVFVTIDNLTATIEGWIRGRDGKNDEFARNPHDWGKAYFVPKKFLRSLDLLKLVNIV